MYESAHFISSKTLGLPRSADARGLPGTTPTTARSRLHIRSYADRFDLRSHIQFDTGVVHAAFSIRTDLGNSELTDGRRVRACYLVCANGVTWEPNVISWFGFRRRDPPPVTYRDASECRRQTRLCRRGRQLRCRHRLRRSLRRGPGVLSVRMRVPLHPEAHLRHSGGRLRPQRFKLPHWLEVRAFGVMLRLMNGDPLRQAPQT